MPILCCHQGLFLWNLIALDCPVLKEYLVERERQRLQSLFPDLWLQLAFPDDDAVPAHRSQFVLHPQVALLVPPYLGYPELTVRLWNLATLRVLNRKS